jgi:hypothetical protein
MRSGPPTPANMTKITFPSVANCPTAPWRRVPFAKEKHMKSVVEKIGFFSGLLAFAATVGYCIVQALQLYGVLDFPTDERLIYGTSLCIVLPFLIQMLALHYTVPPHKRFWTHLALIFATLYAVFVTANYVVQLATVIPMSLKGSLNEVRILQQTPHSLFWDFDALGYIFMGLATLAAVPVFEKQGFQKWVRRAMLANALMTPLIGVVYFSPEYSYNLLLLGLPWAVTAPLSMLLLALHFKKEGLEDQWAGRHQRQKSSRKTALS